jgi:hypothetical protein
VNPPYIEHSLSLPISIKWTAVAKLSSSSRRRRQRPLEYVIRPPRTHIVASIQLSKLVHPLPILSRAWQEKQRAIIPLLILLKAVFYPGYNLPLKPRKLISVQHLISVQKTHIYTCSFFFSFESGHLVTLPYCSHGQEVDGCSVADLFRIFQDFSGFFWIFGFFVQSYPLPPRADRKRISHSRIMRCHKTRSPAATSAH